MGTFTIILAIIAAIFYRVVWGVAAQKVIDNKGYDELWFWWGFFFGIIALLVALSKPKVEYEYTEESKYSDEIRKKDILKNNGWTCAKCGRINHEYMSTCSCGLSRWDNEKYIKEQKEAEEKENEKKKEIDNLQILKEYKNLLDTGVLTQEEFDKKKNEILSL